jgi:hypothetical protein
MRDTRDTKRIACIDGQVALEKAENLLEQFEFEQSVQDCVSSAFADTSHERTVHAN